MYPTQKKDHFSTRTRTKAPGTSFSARNSQLSLPIEPIGVSNATAFSNGSEDVIRLEEHKRHNLQRLHAKGMLWKALDEDSSFSSLSSSPGSVVFRLSNGGKVFADGNCLFKVSQKAMGEKVVDVRKLR